MELYSEILRRLAETLDAPDSSLLRVASELSGVLTAMISEAATIQERQRAPDRLRNQEDRRDGN